MHPGCLHVYAKVCDLVHLLRAQPLRPLQPCLESPPFFFLAEISIQYFGNAVHPCCLHVYARVSVLVHLLRAQPLRHLQPCLENHEHPRFQVVILQSHFEHATYPCFSHESVRCLPRFYVSGVLGAHVEIHLMLLQHLEMHVEQQKKQKKQEKQDHYEQLLHVTHARHVHDPCLEYPGLR